MKKIHKGITLIELIIIIIVIGLVGKFGLPNILGFTTDGRIKSLDEMATILRNTSDIIFEDSFLKKRHQYPMYAGQDMYSVVQVVCNDDRENSTSVCTSFGNPSALGNGIISAISSKKSIKRMERVGECEALWGWCFYNPDVIRNKGTQSQDSLQTGAGTVYLAPAKSVGYTGFVVDSCVVSYTLSINSDNSSSVNIEVYSDGC
jgi:type II secretory pathway pseudopilin PulG